MQQSKKFNININAKELPSVTCRGILKSGDLCGSDVFLQCVELKVASALMTGAGQDTVINAPVYRCIECGTLIRTLEPDPAVEGAARKV
jgi:hypothetical protein